MLNISRQALRKLKQRLTFIIHAMETITVNDVKYQIHTDAKLIEINFIL